MKISCFIAVFFVFFSIELYAEPSLGIGAGGEINGYSQGGLAVGVGGAVDYRFTEMFSFGLRGLYTFDLEVSENAVSVIEITGNLRWYFLRFTRLLNYYYIWQSRFHVFAQADIGGAFVYMADSESRARSGFSWGASAGARIVFGNFYTEPYLRYSSTGSYGLGVMLGCIFRPYGD